MEPARLWTRMGSWFRHAVRTNGDEAADVGLSALSVSDDGGAGAAIRPSPDGDGARRRGGGPDRSGGADEMKELVESVRADLTAQTQSVEAVRVTLERVAELLERVAGDSPQLAELLTGMAGQIDAGAAASKKAEESLSELPRIADAQRETMVSVARQLDLLHGSAERSAGALTEFKGSVTHLGEAGDATLAALSELRADLRGIEARCLGEYRRQAAKFALIGWTLAGIASAALILAAIGLFR